MLFRKIEKGASVKHKNAVNKDFNRIYFILAYSKIVSGLHRTDEPWYT